MALFFSKKVFTTTQQIREALYRIRSLDFEERAKVFEALKKELDDGGVTKEELRLAARQLRNKGDISEVDKKNLLELLQE